MTAWTQPTAERKQKTSASPLTITHYSSEEVQSQRGAIILLTGAGLFDLPTPRLRGDRFTRVAVDAGTCLMNVLRCLSVTSVGQRLHSVATSGVCVVFLYMNP